MNIIEFATIFCVTVLNLNTEQVPSSKKALQCIDSYVKCFGAEQKEDEKIYGKNYEALYSRLVAQHLLTCNKESFKKYK